MSGEELFTAEGDQLLRLIQAGATTQLLRVTPVWTTTNEAEAFSDQLEYLYENINKLEGSRHLAEANHRFIVRAKLDCLKVASKLDNDLFKQFYADISVSIESFPTDFKRYWYRLSSFPYRTFMKIDKLLPPHKTPDA